MRQIFVYLLLLPLTFGVVEEDSTGVSSSNKERKGFTRLIYGMGVGRYADCGGYHEYLDGGISLTRFNESGFTYGGNVNLVKTFNGSKGEMLPLFSGNLGYSSEYFEVRGGIGFPMLLNMAIRGGTEDYNLHLGIFTDTPPTSGTGFINLGLNISEYFGAGISLGLPSGYYVTGNIPLNPENKLSVTFKLDPTDAGQLGVSVSVIHFNF